MHSPNKFPLLALLVFLTGSRLAAQDVTLGDPVWIWAGTPPQDLAAVKEGLNPAYPEAMRGSGQIGYATIVRYVTAKGRTIMLEVEANGYPFQREIQQEAEGDGRNGQFGGGQNYDAWNTRPLRQDGHAVDTFFWLPVIFNPASASADGPNATPRLLALTPVYVSTKFLNRPPGSTLAHLRILVDATGAVKKVVPTTPGTERFHWPTIRKAVEQWKFAPARRDGKPVPAEIELTVVPQQYLRFSDKVDRMPQPVDAMMPEYPASMRNFGMRGTVTVDFIAAMDGKVRDVTVVESSNPGFNESAVNAVSQWTYRPGLSNGHPVNVHFQESIVFQLDQAGGGQEAYETGNASAASPGGSVSPHVRAALSPVYPYALLCDRVDGDAKAWMLVDKRGRVIHVEVTEASRPEFGQSLQAALEGFRFDPALNQGVPVAARVSYEQAFRESDFDNSDDGAVLGMDRHNPGMIRNAGELDQPLKPLSRQSPIFPLSLIGKAASGSATIEFLINENGHVCLPRIVQATDPAFGYAAIQAISVWRFDPPTAGGSPAVVRVRVPFNFHPAS